MKHTGASYSSATHTMIRHTGMLCLALVAATAVRDGEGKDDTKDRDDRDDTKDRDDNKQLFRRYDSKVKTVGEMKAVTCLTQPTPGCGGILKKLLKSVELGRVRRKISETKMKIKTKIAKMILKSYFRKQSNAQHKSREDRMRLNHLFKIL